MNLDMVARRPNSSVHEYMYIVDYLNAKPPTPPPPSHPPYPHPPGQASPQPRETTEWRGLGVQEVPSGEYRLPVKAPTCNYSDAFYDPGTP
jgi:hypothetical protein